MVAKEIMIILQKKYQVEDKLWSEGKDYNN